MKSFYYKNAKEEMIIINWIVSKGLANEVDKFHNPNGSGHFSTRPEFGTISWAIKVANTLRDKAISSGKKARTKSQQFYIDILFNYSTISGKRGYIVMTETEFKYANGLLSAEKVKDIAFKGRRFICAAQLSLDGKFVELISLR